MVPDYLRELDQIRGQIEATPELSLREPLLRLIRAFSQDAGRPGLLIAPEANAEEAGQPDIFVKDGPRLVGFVETKAPDTNLERSLRSDRQLNTTAPSCTVLIRRPLRKYALLHCLRRDEHGRAADPET